MTNIKLQSVRVTLPLYVESDTPIGAFSFQTVFPEGIKPISIATPYKLKKFVGNSLVTGVSGQKVTIGFISPSQSGDSQINATDKGYTGLVASIVVEVSEFEALSKFTSQTEIADKLGNILWKPAIRK